MAVVTVVEMPTDSKAFLFYGYDLGLGHCIPIIVIIIRRLDLYWQRRCSCRDSMTPKDVFGLVLVCEHMESDTSSQTSKDQFQN